MNMFFSAAFKAKARAALQQHWQTALLIALIVNLPTLLMQGIAAFTNNDVITRLEDLALRASGSSAAMSALPEAVRAMLAEPGIIVMTVLNVLAWLITPVLEVGMNHWTLERLRGQELPVSAVFSRLRIFLKSIGLRLVIVLKVLLWMLPGIAAFVLSMIPLFRAEPGNTESVYSAANVSIHLVYLSMIAMTVLGVMGYLYYAMADLILADEPEERVLSCIRRSKAMMKGRRSVLMSLLLSFLLWYLLVILISSFIEGIAGSVIGMMLQMLGSLFISVYMLASEGAFYESLRNAPVQEIPADVPSPDDQNLD
jgi:uncharacterized membrane protein